jgi:hypothetical protein
MLPPCKHKRAKKIKGTITVEIRHFQSKTEWDHIEIIKDNECSLCFVENANQGMQTNSLTNYFHPPNVYHISLPTPNSYEELQQLLAIAIPNDFGPATIERPDGIKIIAESCLFKDGETIVFREIRPSTEKDFDIQKYYKKFNDIDMYKSFESVHELIR